MNEIKQRKRQMKIIGLFILIACIILLISSNSLQAGSQSDTIAEAILADPSCLISSSYSDTDQEGNRQIAIFSSLGPFTPTEGEEFVLISSGIAGATPVTTNEENPGDERGTWFQGGKYNYPRDQATLTMTLEVPEGMNYLYYDVQFLSTEYPEWVGTQYNDKLTIIVDSPSYDESYYVFDINSGHFVYVDDLLADLAGSGFNVYSTYNGPAYVDVIDTTYKSGRADAGASNLVTIGGTTHPVCSQEIITVTIDIHDTGDNILDSTAFIDNLRFSEYARPDISALKTVEDLNGGNVKTNDILKYAIEISNTGIIDHSNNPGNEIEDFIPENSEYVPGSATASSGTVSYDSNENKIFWNGAIPGESSIIINFNVQLFDDLMSTTVISNQAEVQWDKNNDGSNEEFLLTNWANVTIHNTPPVAVNDTASIEEDASVYLDVLSNDYDTNGLLFCIHNYSLPSSGNIIENDNETFTYTPDEDFSGNDSFTYTIIHILAENESGLEDEMDTAMVTITVNPKNDAPVISPIPGQSICDGEYFTDITLDDYVSDPDNTDDELEWSVYTARTLWRNIETGSIVASDFLDWITIDERVASISYPTNESEWGRPGPADEYAPVIEDALFVFKPQFNVEDPQGASDFDSSVGNFTVYSTFESPASVTETFSQDETGGRASQSFEGREWFITGSDGLGCNFEVSDAFEYETSNSFKTKIREDGSPLSWEYDLEAIESDVTAWEIWVYCGKTSDYSDVILDLRNKQDSTIAKLKLEYNNNGEGIMNWIPGIYYWNGDSWITLEENLNNAWYKLRINRNFTKTDYLLYNSNEELMCKETASLSKTFSGLSEIAWSSTENAIVCPIFFWDDHTLYLQPIS